MNREPKQHRGTIQSQLEADWIASGGVVDIMPTGSFVAVKDGLRICNAYSPVKAIQRWKKKWGSS